MTFLNITKNEAGKRLDLALTDLLGGVTRADVKKEIEGNRVLVNSKVEYRAGYKVKVGDKVSINLQSGQVNKYKSTKIAFEVVFENRDLIVINKPTGIPVTPTTDHISNTVMNGLTYLFDSKKQDIQPKLVHRLDKNTSGILIVAKSSEAQRYYSKQFADRNVTKTYIALTSGTLHSYYRQKLGTGFTVKTFVLPTLQKDVKMKIVKNYEKGAREAITNFKLLKQKGDKFLFELTPQTGRTHQLRLHCKYIGTPVVGDHMYGEQRSTRLMLHALSIEMKDMHGNKMKLATKLPTGFEL